MYLGKQPPSQKERSDRFTPKERRYYDFLHSKCACCITGYYPFEIAHTGGLAQGKGMGRKARLETCLPLRTKLHHFEERNRAEFWKGVGIPDYLDWAVRLYDIFEANDDPTSLLLDMQDQANRGFVLGILKGER